MTQEDTFNWKIIDTLIQENKSFALYRIPGSPELHFVMQRSGSVRSLDDIDELNGQCGYVIAPFKVTRDCPILLIRPDITELPEIETPLQTEVRDTPFLPDEAGQAAAYARTFSAFMKPLHEEQFLKLVLSRDQCLPRKAGFSPAQTFFAACKRYTRSYIYLCHTPQSGTWLGSTPEIILSGEADNWVTVALAGTQPLIQGELPTTWDDKNCEEQRLVASYVQEQLATLGIQATEKGPYAAHAAALSHLKSDFYFTLPAPALLGKLLKRLHPTPAVCGLPKEDTYRFILRNEGYNRRYYSGFIGWLNPKGRTDLYVNLRCMCIGEQQLTLYAGGGLLASSSLQSEWQETEDKMQTMKRLIDIQQEL